MSRTGESRFLCLGDWHLLCVAEQDSHDPERPQISDRHRGDRAPRSARSIRPHSCTTTLADGTLICSTRAQNNPLKFLLGGNQVIAGVDEGVTGMRVGERRKLIVPPSLSKRSVYPPNTPPDATLYYDIELLEIDQK